MLNTKVRLLATMESVQDAIATSKKLIICAGRWGKMCIPVYRAMENLETEEKYTDISFRAVDFDGEAAYLIRTLEACCDFMGLPFTVYYRDSTVVHATSSIQSKEQLEDNIKRYLLSGSG